MVAVQILAHAKSRGRDIINGRFLSQFEQKDVADRIGAGVSDLGLSEALDVAVDTSGAS